MDAHSLSFADNSFDAIVTRNLTWNLERPGDAYRDWHRGLRPGGVLLNFDAGWYSYLFDAEKAEGYREDRERAAKLGVEDFNAYSEGYLMEEISRKLVFSRMINEARAYIQLAPWTVLAPGGAMDFAVFDRAVRILQVRAARPHGFDLGSGQFDAGFVTLQHEKFVKSLPVGRDLLHALLLRHRFHPSSKKQN